MRLSGCRRRALSEVIGTVLVASMTLIAGAAIFGYVNGQAGVASRAYGQAVGNSVQYLEEKFTVVDIVASNVTCGTSTCASFTLWIYNTGRIDLSLVQVRLYDPAAPSKWNLDLMYNYSTIGGTTVDRVHDISAGASKCSIDTNSYETPVLTGTGAFSAQIGMTATIQFIVPPTSATPTGSTCPSFGQLVHSDTYYATAVGLYGNTNTYSQVA
ncbi:MAG: type IV pilin N-terminal domain-containing protein [Nitrososphaerota archaeon]|nr:type IV pilin N-terminal domain-containing protein [Nitrososphaerota archaeon]MDG6973143.1 type IV pilin N-terminal domain-containing protein [Nitrososphaerota archaeon]